METRKVITITRELLDSFEFIAYGWVDDGYDGKLADAIIRAMGISGCCTMWKRELGTITSSHGVSISPAKNIGRDLITNKFLVCYKGKQL